MGLDKMKGKGYNLGMPEKDSTAPLPEPTDDLIIIPRKKYAKVPRVMINDETGEAIELTKKQCTFLRHVPEMGRTGAAKYAKISDELAHSTLKLPPVQQYMRKVLWAAGVTESKIAQRISEGLDATTVKEFSDGEGGVIEGTERPDHEQRGKFIDRALRLQGLDKNPAEAGGAAGLPAGVSLVGLSVDDLKTLVTALRGDLPKPAQVIDVVCEPDDKAKEEK